MNKFQAVASGVLLKEVRPGPALLVRPLPPRGAPATLNQLEEPTSHGVACKSFTEPCLAPPGP